MLAKWSNKAKSNKYPAMVKSIYSKKRISLQFYDGVEKLVDLQSIQRLDPSLQKEVRCIYSAGRGKLLCHGADVCGFC